MVFLAFRHRQIQTKETKITQYNRTIRKVESLSQENSPEINSIINQDSPD